METNVVIRRVLVLVNWGTVGRILREEGQGRRKHARLQTLLKVNGFLVSKETVVLRRWERSKQKFSFIKRVDKD